MNRIASPKIIRLAEVDSTNNRAKEAIRSGAAEGTVIISDTQTSGRGLGQHVWHSPQGGLYLSAVLAPKTMKRQTDLAILAGAATTQAVKTLLPKQKDVSVKWPNDCLVDWKKVGGVLCESISENHLCVVGIGINVNITEVELAPFKQNPFSATSFLIESGGGEFDLAKVTDVTLTKLFQLYELYHAEGFEPIKYIWERNCKFIGKKVELRESDWQENPRPLRSGSTVGTCLGIDENGALVLSNHKGERHQYINGEMTCFWQ